ncbi:leucine-rich repeat-containing protein 17 [Anguilla anguilla]|uniref:leucine-rich repeat-containing protein 17 n=1 Tax=Anguilla anguilla TaxID=7936 RepID=UPI0015B335DE|nr:leucine-rich repeat-containing protein 17 [Anguilla anguilla]
MRVIALLVLLALGSAEVRKARPGGRRGRGRSGRREGTVKRFAGECKEYTEAGDKYLDCQDRHLTAVVMGWPEDTVHLLLARNKIQVLRDNTFSQFRNLKSLDLQQNQINMIEEGAFAGLDQLTTLLLQHNHLQVLTEDVLIPLPRLKHLRVYDNPWSCRCHLDSLVRHLQVPSHRNLGNYAKCAEPANLRGQKLKRVKVELLCPELEENNLKPEEIPHKPIMGDKHVDATTSCRTYMFPKPLLDCRNQDLKNVPADLPSDIVKMDLSKNSIRQLKAKEFVAAKDLKLLNLSSNNLDRIDTAAFSGLLYLRELDLSNNSLRFFQYGVLEDLYFIRKLMLGDNPWICDYNIHYLIYWLKHHTNVEYSGLVCSSPPEYSGWPVENYVKTYNAECPKDILLGQTDTAQELTAETEEEEIENLPRPLTTRKKFEIIRLS